MLILCICECHQNLSNIFTVFSRSLGMLFHWLGMFFKSRVQQQECAICLTNLRPSFLSFTFAFAAETELWKDPRDWRPWSVERKRGDGLQRSISKPFFSPRGEKGHFLKFGNEKSQTKSLLNNVLECNRTGRVVGVANNSYISPTWGKLINNCLARTWNPWCPKAKVHIRNWWWWRHTCDSCQDSSVFCFLPKLQKQSQIRDFFFVFDATFDRS